MDANEELQVDTATEVIGGFGRFLVAVAAFLTVATVRQLANVFNYPPARIEKLENDENPGYVFVMSLRERGIIVPNDVSNLIDALKDIDLHGIAYEVTKAFEKHCKQKETLESPNKGETMYTNEGLELDTATEVIGGFSRFLVTVAAFLTIATVRKLAYVFNYPPARIEKLENDENPGYVFVMSLRERGIIVPNDVSNLIDALKDIDLHGIAYEVTKAFEKHCKQKETLESPNKGETMYTNEGLELDTATEVIGGFSRFLVTVAAFLTIATVRKLAYVFNYPPARIEELEIDENPGYVFVMSLREKGIIKPEDVSVLIDALRDIDLHGVAYEVTIAYEKHCKQKETLESKKGETMYTNEGLELETATEVIGGFSRFLVTVAAFLTIATVRKLAYVFNYPPARIEELEIDENPGYVFVMSLREKGIIKPEDVSVLIDALRDIDLHGVAYEVTIAYEKHCKQKETLESKKAQKASFINSIKITYRKLYAKVQPIPFIRDKLLCVDNVFIDSGVERLIKKKGKGAWQKLESYHFLFNELPPAPTRCILFGEPGFGKSTLALQLVYDWCNNCSKSPLKEIDILIFLRLRQLIGVSSIFTAIKQFILPRNSPLRESDITEIVYSSKSVVIVLDGFDEYANKNGEEDDDVTEIIKGRMFQKFFVVVTTRPSFKPIEMPATTVQLRLTGFDSEAQDNYLCKTVGDNDLKAISKIKSYIEENHILRDLCESPLFFAMFSHMFYEKEMSMKFDSATSFVRYMIDSFHEHMKNKLDGNELKKYKQLEKYHRKLDKASFEALTGEQQKVVWMKKHLQKLIGRDLYNQYIAVGILVEEETFVFNDKHDSLTSPPLIRHIQTRFYHRLFCEWYAAHHISDLATKAITLTLNRTLRKIDPFELHYVLRFACGISPTASSRIIKYLQTLEGGDKFAILCILEQTGQVDDILDSIRKLCFEGVIISGYDSLLLQRSSLQLLEIAAKHNISIKYVHLSNCLQSVDLSTFAIRTTSGLTLTSRIPVKLLAVDLTNRDMTEDEAVDILQFASMCPSLRELLYSCCVPPLVFTNQSTLSSLKSRDVKVSWSWGTIEPEYILNLQTGRWENKNDGSEPTVEDFERMLSLGAANRKHRIDEEYRETVKENREALRKRAEERQSELRDQALDDEDDFDDDDVRKTKKDGTEPTVEDFERMGKLFAFRHLKGKLSSVLQRNDCEELTEYFDTHIDQLESVSNSELFATSLLNLLEEKRVITPSNVVKLEEAFSKLQLEPSLIQLVEEYQNTRAPATSDVILKRVLALLEGIKQTQAIHGAQLQLLLKQADVQESTINFELPEGLTFPIKTKEELEGFDLRLEQDKAFFKGLVIMLGDKGGRNLEEMVKRVMAHVMTDNFALQCNVSGRNKKTGFGQARMFDVVYNQPTTYDRFLASMSVHLNPSLIKDLCTSFSDKEINVIKSSESPGLSLLEMLDDKKVIQPSDVGALRCHFEKFKLVQSLAKIDEYESLVIEEKLLLQINAETMQVKRDIFVKCLRSRMKSWYETMTPVPWKKSCKWKAAELFIGSGLILTSSKKTGHLKNIDEDCKLEYTGIFSREDLQSELRIIIEGDPGSGKTMLSYQISYDWSQGKIPNVDILILLPLKYVEEKTLVSSIKELYVPSTAEISEKEIEALINSEAKSVCFLLDGLEEYNPGSGLAGKELSEIMKVMNRHKYPSCKVIVTCRSDFAKNLPASPMLKVGRFGEKERDTYIKNLKLDIPQKQKIRQAMDGNAFIKDLCSLPLLFILSVHNIESIGSLGDIQFPKVTPFIKTMMLSLCSTSDLRKDIENLNLECLASLGKLAFKGLCQRYQQLSWQKEFMEISVSNFQQWIDCGVLLFEEDIRTEEEKHMESQSKTQNEKKVVEELALSPSEVKGDTTQREIAKDPYKSQPTRKHETGKSLETGRSGKQKQTGNQRQANKELFPESNLNEFIPEHIEDKQNIGTEQATGKTNGKERLNTNEVSFVVKFLHKIFQEWFAALHFCFITENCTTVDQLHKTVSDYLLNIHPTDLHYLLRFTCYFCPKISHIIMNHLLSSNRTETGEIPQNIMDYVFLCFTEHQGDRGPDIRDTVMEICQKPIVIQAQDSGFLQKAKTTFLEYAAASRIVIETLELNDVVSAVKMDTLILEFEIQLQIIHTLREVRVASWDNRLKDEDYRSILHFLTKGNETKRIVCTFPERPEVVTDKPTLQRVNSNNMKVKWIIGNVTHNLDRETGEWKAELSKTSKEFNVKYKEKKHSSIVHPQVLYPKHMKDRRCLSSVTFPDEDPKRKRAQTETSDHKGNPETNKENKILHTAGESFSDHKEKKNHASAENIFLTVEETICQSGGTLEIPNTRVKLHIPPDALPEKVESRFIQLRIIPQGMIGDEIASTFWNTSTVVELLPNKLQLRKNVKLILPHCFVLKGPRPSAKVLVSHHEQGNKPLWVEDDDCNCMVQTTSCIVHLKRFCWVRLRINDTEILAKKIVLYTAGKKPVPKCKQFTVVVGYYPDIPGEDKFFQLNPNLIVTERKIFNFFKEQEKPLRLSSTETIPETWKLCAPKQNIEEILFATISSSVEHSRPFTFKNEGRDNDLPILHFKASQEEGMQPVELTINLEELRDCSPQPQTGHSDPMKILCWEVSEDLSNEWKAVGRKLNFTDAQLNQFEMDNAGHSKETIYAMFLDWLQRRGKNATRSTLSSALRDAGRKDLADLVTELD